MALWGFVTGRLMVILVVVVASCLGCEGRGCHDNERGALLEIKKLLNPPSDSSDMYHWGDSTMEEGKNCCQWFGITCNPNTGHVVGLYLYGEDRSDVEETWRPNLTMLAEFGQLESLNLWGNQIGGGILEGE
ncbi:unnamed protein product [Spirodela intermedia]|uniref:Leucine-rich repeat-containing N-terminal plant-type domain-containing protein n=1 Tax=Spirodela intermedia TaxID=51605 RepID=A0A7I8LJ39_SPIIN|nr:unnamed protein product [Spirodela intermedia]